MADARGGMIALLAQKMQSLSARGKWRGFSRASATRAGAPTILRLRENAEGEDKDG